MSNSVNDEDLNDVLSIFKEAVDSPLDSRKDQTDLLDKRKEGIINISKNTKLGQYPSEMSCITAFDEVFSCYSVGGQLRNYYRFGELNSCAPAYEKFMFCIKNTASRKSDDEKKLEVQRFYKKQFLLKKAKGSSEDIWDIRK